jgi:ACS family tartrate transporter-like MFS transporter
MHSRAVRPTRGGRHECERLATLTACWFLVITWRPSVPQAVTAPVSADAVADNERRIVGRVIRRLIPFIFLCYVVAYIDRVNIGFAASLMQRDLGLSDWDYGLGAGLFFLGYCLFEIPSNLVLDRVGARLWIARIMIVWGLVSMGMVFVWDSWSFFAARVLLGIAEAGFFPGMVLYLTYWIPASARARAGALFMMAAPIAMITGAPLSEGLLALDGLFGVVGWHWLFLVEGLPAVILGVMALRVLTDRPEHATWLPPDDRAWLSARMQREREERAAHHPQHTWRALANPKVLVLALIYFLNTLVTYGLFLWLPRILRDTSGYDGWRLSLITALPFTAALAAMILIGRHSDRTGERKMHVAVCALTAAVGLVGAALFQHNVVMLVLCFTLCQIGQRSVMSVFWAIPPIFLGGTAAAAGIALINSIGNLGGFFGPSVMGWLRGSLQSYTSGLFVLAGSLLIAAVLVASLKLPEPKTRTA